MGSNPGKRLVMINSASAVLSRILQLVFLFWMLAFLAREIEKSELNANPKDTKDYEEGVWTLPPTLTLKDKDKDKYTAIGESDRMTLRFRKK